ncbi:hypothetical protein R1flu_029065 [Riccia fluitans]|uniref:Uncharacterized protein n=1 Tax=Riccia fluitans TaxID=41844 RepID=A0ABD1XNG2_9MARC
MGLVFGGGAEDIACGGELFASGGEVLPAGGKPFASGGEPFVSAGELFATGGEGVVDIRSTSTFRISDHWWSPRLVDRLL